MARWHSAVGVMVEATFRINLRCQVIQMSVKRLLTCVNDGQLVGCAGTQSFDQLLARVQALDRAVFWHEPCQLTGQIVYGVVRGIEDQDGLEHGILA